MSHKLYFWSIGIGTIGVWSAFGALTQMTTPAGGNGWLLGGFFGILFLALAGTGTAIMTMFWCRGGACFKNHHRIVRGLRHGVLLALLGTICAGLQWYGYLTWWTSLLVCGALILYELRIILLRRAF